MSETELGAKMRQIEAGHAGVTGDDEPARAARAIDEIRKRLADARSRAADEECSYVVRHESERILFYALCFRYGLKPFRRPRAHSSTISLRAPRPFLDTTLWPVFTALADELHSHLDDVTARVLRGAFPETVVSLPDGVEGTPPAGGA